MAELVEVHNVMYWPVRDAVVDAVNYAVWRAASIVGDHAIRVAVHNAVEDATRDEV
jgi:hypothetical protein